MTASPGPEAWRCFFYERVFGLPLLAEVVEMRALPALDAKGGPSGSA